MEHVAIDLGLSKSKVCVRAASGEVIVEAPVPTLDLAAFLRSRPHSRVVLETCAESFKIGEAARQIGHEVRVVPATLARQLGVGQRGIKTDKRDARALSEASCRIDLPSVHVRSSRAREHLTQLGMRQALVTARTQLVNTVRGWLRTELVRVRSTPETFPANARKTLLARPEGTPMHVEQVLLSIEALTAQIKAADAEVKRAAEAHEVCPLLMTVPGVGPVTSLAYVATIDDPHRFTSARVQSYLGLTPGENSSSLKVRRTGVTKAGPALLRHLLGQSAHTLLRTRGGTPAALWAERIKKRRGSAIAAVALARKLSGVLLAMWLTRTSYDPTRAALTVEAPAL
jgi:transposase